ncbi:hypothetical protein NM688_g7310 [Phlebia brevispora]|uniref:Uncharacterized protein n=1 Tax=Phlebia brevispora TaxID=194682 RepID=A0ACC1S6X3_9APHY|nr:hypothetical protein NM688_g7310 [Phlebia brevispora]
MSADLMPAPVFKGEIMDFDLGMEIDHRKRRRNRTTQSCLNCHTSKRKCDRKRPCHRCIQLGLTGLCVYEVDDPALRDDPNIDETTRLRNRIAELESLESHILVGQNPTIAMATQQKSGTRERPGAPRCRFNDSALWKTLKTPRRPLSSRPNSRPDSPHQPQLYRMSPSPGPALSFDSGMGSSAYRDGTQSHSQSGCSSPGDQCNNYASSSSSSPSMGYTQSRQSGSVLAMTNTDLYYHQPYIRGSDSSASDPPCGCLTNPAAGHPLISLTHQLQQTIELLRQLPEHAARGSCVILKQITQLNDLMHGGASATTPSPPFDSPSHARERADVAGLHVEPLQPRQCDAA